MSACRTCLRRAALLGFLVPWIERALDERKRIPQVLALSDEKLIQSVCGERRAQADRFLESFDAGDARRTAKRAGLHVVCRHARRYPSALHGSRDGPRALYMKGNLDLLDELEYEHAVALVGSRRASPYGREVAHRLGGELAAAGVPVVSGLAFGIDAAAHAGALAASGPAVVVMPSGVDVAYPRAHRALHRRLCEHGLAVSELPPGTTPLRWCFPARNRIMAGLAHMTVVVEGTATSGSLITAQFAQDLGREVGAVPGQITSGVAAGPNSLLADGACVVRSATDVLDAIYGVGARHVPESRSRTPLEPRLAGLLAAVEEGRSVDALVRAGAEVGQVLAGLTELELLGLVRRDASGAYLRRATDGAYA
jgi:DNA processing protein